MFLATAKQSCKFLSISFKTSLEAPLKIIEHAVGFLHSVIKVKYSSPIYCTSKRPQRVPTSSSASSSVLFTILAPDTLAILVLSVFLILLITETFPLSKKCYARSETPFSVITTSGFNFTISLHIRAISSISYFKASVISLSFIISKLVIDSPFLYSKGQSSKITLGFLI